MKWIFALASFLGYGYVSFLHSRNDFASFLAVILVLFGSLFYFYRERSQLRWKEVLFMSIAFRLIFIGHTPELSNDYCRFLWDGMIVNHGENPYVQTPDNYPFFQAITIDGSRHEGSRYYANMNSAQYYSPYPAVCQYIWGFSESLFSSVHSKIVALRFIILLFEIGTILLLFKSLKLLGKDNSLVAMYALNPLVILEFTGSLHPEVFMLFFLVLALFLYLKNKTVFSAMAFGFAIASKILPLIILPFLINKIGFKKAFVYGIIAAVTAVLLFVPFYDPVIPDNIQSSVGLYFGQFYFNASLFYVVKEISDWMNARDLRFEIAPILSFISTAIILSLAFFKRKSADLFVRILFAFSVYFLFSTTVHPWYIGIIALIGVFTNYTFSFVWCMLAMLSYSHYSGGQMREHYAWIILEYGILIGWIIFELWKRYRNINSESRVHSTLSGL
ncbi:MAG: hypothetical protein ACKVOK_04470 [Flavobacteriales bacterium]